MLRSWTEAVAAGVLALAAGATAIWPHWLESLTGFEPDGGDGGTEWGLVAGLAAAGAACALAARRHYLLSRKRSGPVPG